MNRIVLDTNVLVAVTGGCRYIVTHNRADFRAVPAWGIEAVTPGRFLRILGSLS